MTASDGLALAKEQSKLDREANDRQQARVALYDQHMPVLVPIDDPISSNAVQFAMHLENKGTGVALNTWGCLAMDGLPLKYHFKQMYFLVPDRVAKITFGGGEAHYPTNTIGGHNIFPFVDTGGIPGSLPVDVRLTVTYNDIFENKYLVVFDHVDGLG